jgi:hypothetical protein
MSVHRELTADKRNDDSTYLIIHKPAGKSGNEWNVLHVNAFD